ncbi:MAG TPA: DNA alkylation repair protein [Tenuifilaceae bacterium]|nr:DNA alkylation repair protein [Tenuifilaceae bacterium]HPE19541.1 DNA alkylation repair protein [Tenuifilaceae bacterium]HPJ47078.1 DNA alkylation repair protein [Tenuifilaceae bacterium]HPQ34833.1 DNA alkylation repair protein [Tenuifilaceae bacterium]HRX68716.1 DNA alkylation repair protein [Tenuifilaceae bacterium]
MRTIDLLKKDLQSFNDKKRGTDLLKFFQVFPGGYGEGDKFIGVTVPNQRAVSKKYYKEISIHEIEELLSDEIHEYRLTATFMLVLKYQKEKDENKKQEFVDAYIGNLERINNWDLVDSSAHLILGPHLMDRDKSLLYDFAKSENLWVQRVSIIATFHFIRNGKYEDALRISEMLLNHKHDLIHKAVGWMVREIGNRDFDVEYNFLLKHYKKMPRTMLRYAIEKFPEELRQRFLKGEV